MKTILMMTIFVGFLTSIGQAATSSEFEEYFLKNSSPQKLGFEASKEGIKTVITLLSCSEVATGEEQSGDYGVCSFQANGFSLNGVYSVIVNPAGYGFAKVVEVGNFLD